MCKCNSLELLVESDRYDQHVLLELPECSERKRRIHEGLSTNVCIDPCITEEIKSLWADGIVTTGCCCGHKFLQPFVNVADESVDKMLSLGYECWHPDPDRIDTFKLKSVI